MTFYNQNPQLENARRIVSGATCRILTDGKAGDEAQCLGVAERLGLLADIRRIAPRRLFQLLAPFGPIDPRDAPSRPDGPIAPPWPEIAIASGRRTVPYLRRLKREAGGATLTVFLKDPRTGAGTADLIWVPAHDRLRGQTVIVTITSPHRIAPQRLMEAETSPSPWPEDSRPVVGVLLGGNSQHHRFTQSDISALSMHLAAAARDGYRLVVTASRRTPPALVAAVQSITEQHAGWLWDSSGDNPYLSILAKADHLVVTADSVNMLGEAAATGTPIHLFTPSGGHTKISTFVKALADHGAVRPLGNHLETFTYQPLDATDEIAIRVAAAYQRLRMQSPSKS